MIRKVVVTSILICSVIASYAQKEIKDAKDEKFRFSAGPELGFAVGTAADRWTVGVGISAQAEHLIAEKVSLTALVGVNSFPGKSAGTGLNYKSFTVAPLRLGGRYYFTNAFHAGLQLGVGFLSEAGSSKTAFAYSPQIGYNFDIQTDRSIDVTLKLDAYSKDATNSFLGLRVGYIF